MGYIFKPNVFLDSIKIMFMLELWSSVVTHQGDLNSKIHKFPYL